MSGREPATSALGGGPGFAVGDAPSGQPFGYHPGEGFTPLVLSFPHVGLEWPERLGRAPQVNFARNADFEVDAIYPAAELSPAARVRARYSRLVVDLNRAEDDISPAVVPDHPAPRPRSQPGGTPTEASKKGSGIENRGVVWTHAVGRIPILRRLDFAGFEARIDAYHRPYYAALDQLLAHRVEHFGYAILLDCHSMPSVVAHDLVLGTLDGASCDPRLADLAQGALGGPSSPTAISLGLRRDDPYRGGEIVRRFGRPNAHVHALQLEVNRGLYMDELRLQLRIASKDAKTQMTSASKRTRELLARIQRLVEVLSRPGLSEL